jgi:hypothetical protein
MKYLFPFQAAQCPDRIENLAILRITRPILIAVLCCFLTTRGGAEESSNSATEVGAGLDQLIGSWKTGTTPRSGTYEFKANGSVFYSSPMYSGESGEYVKMSTEDFQAVQEGGKIVVSPKRVSQTYQRWFEIKVPFDLKSPAAVYFRVHDGKRTQTPFNLFRESAKPDPKPKDASIGTISRTIALDTMIVAPGGSLFCPQGSAVEISSDRQNIPEWAEAIVIRNANGRGPDQEFLIPKDWLTTGAAYNDRPLRPESRPPPSKKLQSQYLEVAKECFFSNAPGRNLVLMPGAQVRAIERRETGREYGNLPGFSIRY